MAVDLKLFDAFNRAASPQGELFNMGSRDVYWDGTGSIYLNFGLSDDRIQMTSPNGSFARSYNYGGCSGLAAAGPFDITSLFIKGVNSINVKIKDICGFSIGTNDVVINGNVQFTPFEATKIGRSSRREIGATIPSGIGCGLGKRRR